MVFREGESFWGLADSVTGRPIQSFVGPALQSPLPSVLRAGVWNQARINWSAYLTLVSPHLLVGKMPMKIAFVCKSCCGPKPH